jgi:hypothetical protein
LWRTDTRADRDELPSAVEILSDHVRIDVAASVAVLEDSYTNHI